MKQALICCAIAFVITAAIGPSVIRYLRKMKFGQKILEIGPKWHMNKQNIPTMGGFMFIIGIALAVILGGLVTGTRWPSSACRRPTARSVWWTTTQRSRKRRTRA